MILVILSLVALVFFAYRGVSIIILAPALAVATFLAEGIFLGQTYGFAVLTETFMKGMSDYVFNYFLIFLGTLGVC